MTSEPNLRNARLKDLIDEVKRRFECSFYPKRNIVLVGAPGSGKGTQAPRLRNEFCLCHLSTGDLLRSEVARGTEIGKQAKSIMDKGALVPDDIMVSIIEKAMDQPECEKGMILDGFPRTIPQAQALNHMFIRKREKLDRAFEFRIPDELLIERVEGRRIHEPSGRVYHVKYNPPKVPDMDDVTGERLIHRKDDTEAVLKTRLANYHKSTTPLLDFYRQQDVLVTIDSARPINDIWDQIKANI